MSEYVIECDYDVDNGLILGEVREEILRCRDCRRFNQEHNGDIGTCDLGLEDTGLFSIVESNGFCKWGIRRDADTQSTSKEHAIEGVLMYLIDSSNTVEFDAMTAIEKATMDIMEIMGGES